MIGRRVALVHPPFTFVSSGGNIYNRKLLEFAGPCGMPLASLPWQGEALRASAWDLIVWDSLLLEHVARLDHERVGLLLHYLPSLEPALEPNRRSMLRAVERRALANTDFAIATGRGVAEAVIAEYPGKRVFLCEPGVSGVFLRNRPTGSGRPLTFLTVSHLLPAKGHDRLLECLRRLGRRRWHWHVVGDRGASPETAGRLREGVRDSGYTDRVTFHGALLQEDVAALMAASDLMVAPSVFEAYGMAVAEAAAAGLPVLAFRVGAAEQLIQHRVTGFLAPVGDWDGFCRYLEVLVDDTTLLALFQDNLRSRAVRRWDETAADFRSACEAML